MNDTELGNAMRRLPRTNASPRFTSDVLRRLHEAKRSPQPRLPFRLAAAFAMMLCVALVSYEAATVHQRHQRLEALRAEHQRLQRELQQVKALADETRPVVVLENADTRVIVPASDRSANHTASQPIMY